MADHYFKRNLHLINYKRQDKELLSDSCLIQEQDRSSSYYIANHIHEEDIHNYSRSEEEIELDSNDLT